jgi:hypothetical protein
MIDRMFDIFTSYGTEPKHSNDRLQGMYGAKILSGGCDILMNDTAETITAQNT